MIALALSRGPRTEVNYIYHRVILVTLVVVLFTPAAESVAVYSVQSSWRVYRAGITKQKLEIVLSAQVPAFTQEFWPGRQGGRPVGELHIYSL